MDQSTIDRILDSALGEIAQADSLEKVKEVEVRYLGKKGELTELLKTLKDLPDEEKRSIGQSLQKAKQSFVESFESKCSELERLIIEASLKKEFFDITMPSLQRRSDNDSGSTHPLSELQKEVEKVFSSMGFQIADGPEVESEYYNFEALNIPPHHPARDMQDTFFLNSANDTKHGRLLLRTQTSPVQIRTMEKYGVPLRIIIPGRVFRYEATDATHDSTFNQVEGLLIDKNIGISALKGVIGEFLSRLFNKEITVRFRPGYFPFVEPGLELDLLWEKGKNGKADKWLEFMGAGMVHPNVLRSAGIDAEKHQGWAFGFGLTRLAMIKYQINDIRLLHSNDLRFLKQF